MIKKSTNKLQSAIMTFIASQILSTHEKEDMYSAFKALDTDGNGVLTREEMIQGKLIILF